MATGDEIYMELQALGKEQSETSKQVALVSQSVGELAGHVADLNTSLVGKGGFAERLTTVETKVYERTRPVKLPARNSNGPVVKAATAKLLKSKAALYYALATSIGAAITALVAYLTR